MFGHRHFGCFDGMGMPPPPPMIHVRPHRGCGCGCLPVILLPAVIMFLFWFIK